MMESTWGEAPATLSGPARSAVARQQLRLDGYEVLGILGQGGMGVVYKARQTSLNRLVALKMILAGAGASSDQITRFRSEAETAASLQHPNIVQVYQVGEADGYPYIALEYIDGPNLAQHLDGQPQSPKEAAELLRILARAIHHAHEHGVIHRDLKPGNVLLGGRGLPRLTKSESDTWTPGQGPIPKVSDFGLAKHLGGELGVSYTGQILGTPSFMAPEQAFGDKHGVGAAADIYALGAILYTVLTGRPPFRGETELDTLDQVRRQEPVPPRQFQPKIPQDLETICLKCLQKDPAKRYASAEAFGEDLRRFLFNEPIKARPTRRTELALRWCRRNPTAAMWLALAMIFLISGISAGTYLGIRAYEGEKLAEAEAAEAEANLALSEQRAYGLEVNRAFQDWKDGQVAVALERLERLKPQPDKPDLRGFEWYHIQRLCRLDLLTIAAHTGPAYALAVSPNGRWIASSGADRIVKVREMASGQEKFSFRGHQGRVQSVVFSPDSRLLASGAWDNSVRIWDLAQGKQIQMLGDQIDRVNGLAFSPDGQRLAAAGGDYKVTVWDVATGREEFKLGGHRGFVRSVTFSPDGALLASSGYDGAVRVWDARTGKCIQVLEGHTAASSQVVFSRDGHQLASAGDDQTVRVWDLGKGQELLRLIGHMSRVTSLAYSPDSRYITSAGYDGMLRIWDSDTGREELVLRGHQTDVERVAYCPDGRRLVSCDSSGFVKVWDATAVPATLHLEGHAVSVRDLAFNPSGENLASASADGTVHIWNATTGDEISILSGHTGGVNRVTYSPDGETLASAGNDGTIRLWNAASGREERKIQAHKGAVCCVAFSPDGSRLASGGADRKAHIWEIATGKELFGGKEQTSAVGGVAFSRDGTTLRIMLDDQTAKIWNAATGEEIGTENDPVCRLGCNAFSAEGQRIACSGSDSPVTVRDGRTGKELFILANRLGCGARVAFNGTGSRLVLSRPDGTVHIWDSAVGQELMTLSEWDTARRTQAETYASVAFSKDGMRVAAGRPDGGVTVWDGVPLSPEMLVRREARSLVAFLFGKELTESEVTASIRQDQTVSYKVRREALALAAPYGRTALQVQASKLVRELFTKPLLRDEVLERVRKNPALSEEVRQRAVALAGQYREQEGTSWMVGWLVGRRPGLEQSEYQAALREAEAGCRFQPEDPVYWESLGTLQYRLAKYEDSIRTFTECIRLCNHPPFEECPWFHAFLAMANHRIGKTDEAKAAFARMEEMMKEPRWVSHPEAESFRREAQRVLAEAEPVSKK